MNTGNDGREHCRLKRLGRVLDSRDVTLWEKFINKLYEDQTLYLDETVSLRIETEGDGVSFGLAKFFPTNS